MVNHGFGVEYLSSKYLPSEAPKKMVTPIWVATIVRVRSRLGCFLLFFLFSGMANIFYNCTHATRTREGCSWLYG